MYSRGFAIPDAATVQRAHKKVIKVQRTCLVFEKGNIAIASIKRAAPVTFSSTSIASRSKHPHRSVKPIEITILQ